MRPLDPLSGQARCYRLMQGEPTQEKSALERAAEHYLQKEAEEEKARKAAAGCAGVGCVLPLAIMAIGAIAIVALGLVVWLLEALFG